jgi:hypothetical protein
LASLGVILAPAWYFLILKGFSQDRKSSVSGGNCAVTYCVVVIERGQT